MELKNLLCYSTAKFSKVFLQRTESNISCLADQVWQLHYLCNIAQEVSTGNIWTNGVADLRR